MRTTVLSAMLLAALAAAVPAAAGEEAPRGAQGVFAPVAAPSPSPATVTSSGPATAAEGTAGIVANPELLTPIVSPAPVRTTAANLRTPAATQGDPSVIPFTVPVPVPAAMAYPPGQQRYPQQYQEQLRQYQEQQYQQQLYQRQQYEEQLRLRREYEQQQEYVRQQHAAMQQQLADQQQQIQQQLQQLAMQQQQISAQTDALQREALALQQQSAAVPYAPFGPYQPVRQFDPNSPVPPQPPMQLAPSARNLPPAQPQFAPPPAQPPFTAPGTLPLPAQDFVNTLRNPSTGGEKPVLSLITPAEVKQALNLGVRLVMLDVRSGLVRDVEGIIPGSVPVPYEPAATFGARVERVIPRSGAFPVVVFCSDGIWSAKATETLAQMGYSAYLMGAYRLWVS